MRNVQFYAAIDSEATGSILYASPISCAIVPFYADIDSEATGSRGYGLDFVCELDFVRDVQVSDATDTEATGSILYASSISCAAFNSMLLCMFLVGPLPPPSHA